jgi:group I intron endonuclease
MGKSGIYKITNLSDGKFYIGSSVDLKRRKSEHAKMLENGTHHSSYLQNAYNKYGKNNFKFEIIELVDDDKLRDVEQRYLDKLKPYIRRIGYNLSERADCPKVNGINSLLSEKKVREIKRGLLRGVTQSDLSNKYGVHLSTINKIIRCKNWAWVLPELNENLMYLAENNKVKRDLIIKKLYGEGKTACEIADTVGCGRSMVTAILGTSSQIELQKRAKAINDDYKNGITKESLMAKYNASRSVVNNAIKATYQQEQERVYDTWRDMRRHGVTISEIAKQYGVHRTTVTKNTKDVWKNQIKTTSVIQADEHGQKIKTFNSIKEATGETGCIHSGIIACCKGRYKTCGGFRWMYYDDYIKKQGEAVELA